MSAVAFHPYFCITFGLNHLYILVYIICFFLCGALDAEKKFFKCICVLCMTGTQNKSNWIKKKIKKVVFGYKMDEMI